MNEFHYVYILQSVNCPSCYYTGCTQDLKSRLQKHNSGEVKHTSKFKPWIIKTDIVIRDKDRAAALERYLKTASGRNLCEKATLDRTGKGVNILSSCVYLFR